MTLAQNSYLPGLHFKMNDKFSKLLGHGQAGAVYLWMMLDIIINVTPDVATGLNTRIKLFGDKGLKGFYTKGDNLVLDYGIICHCLDQQVSLLEDAITDVLKGLSLASQEDFAKLFKDFEITLKKLVLNVELEGTVMDQIAKLMDTVLTQYTSYFLLGQWMVLSTHQATKISTPTPGFKCDNCGDPHFIK